MKRTKILSRKELSEIRAQVERRDPKFGGGYTWSTIEALLDTVEALLPPERTITINPSESSQIGVTVVESVYRKQHGAI